MTVGILTKAQKRAVITIYTSKIKPKGIVELAYFLNVSTRTIKRVLDECKVEWRFKPLEPINKNLTVLKGIDLHLE